MAVKSKIIKKVRNDNKMSLKLCIELDIPQATLFRRIDRKGKGLESLFNDVRVISFLKNQGIQDNEIFESEKMPYSSVTHN